MRVFECVCASVIQKNEKHRESERAKIWAGDESWWLSIVIIRHTKVVVVFYFFVVCACTCTYYMICML